MKAFFSIALLVLEILWSIALLIILLDYLQYHKKSNKSEYKWKK